jgi:hypothetical protein
MTLLRVRSHNSKVFAFAAALLLSAATPAVAHADEKSECAEAGNAAGPLRTAGKVKEAREDLIRCSQASCPKVIRDNCASDLNDVNAELPTIVLRAIDNKGNDIARVKVVAGGNPVVDSLDGNAIPFDPGQVKLSFSADGYRPRDMDVVIARGEKARVIKVVLESIDNPDRPPPAPPPPSSGGVGAGPWVFLGVGAAGLITFAALEGVAQSEYSKLKSGCGATHSCTDSDVAPTRAKFIGAGVALGIGSAATAASIIWFAVGAATHHSSVAIGVGPTSVGVRASF